MQQNHNKNLALNNKNQPIRGGGRFLPRDAMRKRGLCRRAVSTRLSVRHVRVFCRHE